MIEVGTKVPDITFKTRVRDESIEGDNPFTWQDVTTADLFSEKRVVLFALPGAFTPTCSTFQLPGFDDLYSDFQNAGVDEIYCLSVNDSFVMNKWADWAKVRNVKMIPDGSGLFTSAIGMMVDKDNLGFGFRSWRYALLLNDGIVEQAFIEPGFTDNAEDDPYGESDPAAVLNYITGESPVQPKGRQLTLDLEDGIMNKDKLGAD